MNNIILLEEEIAFNHMGECIKMGWLGRELFNMARQGMSHYEEHFVGPGPGNLSSPVSEPKRLSLLSLQWHLCLVGGGGGGGGSGLLPPCSRKGRR
jgi:hypothetical protein